MSHISIDLRVLVFALVLAGLAPAQDGPPPQPDGISIGSLLAEAADLRELASVPEHPFETRTFSHRDSPATRKRGQRTEHVLASAKGPGALVGVWMLAPAGNLRVYVDGSAIPAVEVEAKLALNGEVTMFPSPTSGAVGKGARLLYPVPFAKSVEVTCDADPGRFSISCRRYLDPETTVVSFDPNAALMAYFMGREALA